MQLNIFQDARTLQPVELQVTNLDQNIEQREMKRTITNIFREHVPILHVSVSNHHWFSQILTFLLGFFTNCVDKFLAFFDHLPPSVDILYLIMVDKKAEIFDYLLGNLTPCKLVNVVCERPLLSFR